MSSNNDGFTVGELTITVAVLIVAGLVWTNLPKGDNQKTSSIGEFSDKLQNQLVQKGFFLKDKKLA